MYDHPSLPCCPVPAPVSEAWGPLLDLDPVQEYRALAHELRECFPDAAPSHLDRLIVREMALYGGHSLEVITQAMCQASVQLAGGQVDDVQVYVARTIQEALHQAVNDETALGWGA